MLADSLFSSWLRVTVLWWVSVFIWWGVSNDAVLSAFNAIPEAFFFDVIGKCDLDGVVCAEDTGQPVISAANALVYTGYVFTFWSFPVLLATLLSGAMGGGLAYVTRYRMNKEEEARLKADESWRGVNISLGSLAKPVWIPEVSPVKITLEKSLQEKMQSLEPRHHKVIAEVFGYLHAHPDAFVGDGHKGTLLEHTIGVFQEAIEEASEPMDPLLPIAAAAHDMGKVVTHYKDDNGEWVKRRGNAGFHDYQGGLLLSSLPSFAELSYEEQAILVVLVKYAHKPYLAPCPSENLRERIDHLFDEFRKADKSVTAAEKQEVVEDYEKSETLDDVVTNAFLEAITTFKFQDPNLARSRPAIGWRQGDDLILIEIQFREQFATLLPNDLVAAWGGTERQKNSLAGLTKNFLEWLDKKGWLVREVEVFKDYTDSEPFKTEVCPEGHYPLWNLFSGDKVFKGVYVVRLPEEYKKKLPHQTQFDLKFIGFMKPPKNSAKNRKGAANKAVSKKLQAKRQAADRLAKEKAFEQELSKHPEHIQSKVRKQMARYKAIGMHALAGEDVLKSVLASEGVKGDDNTPKKKPTDKKKPDPRAQLDAKKGRKPELKVFDSLDDGDKKKARALLSKALNSGQALRLEDAAKMVRDGKDIEPVDNPDKSPTRNSNGEGAKTDGPDRKQSETAHGPQLPLPESVTEGAFGTLDVDQKKLANKLLGEALNAGERMTRDEAASVVLEGKYPSHTSGAEVTEAEQVPAVKAKSVASEEAVKAEASGEADNKEEGESRSEKETASGKANDSKGNQKRQSGHESSPSAENPWKALSADQKKEALGIVQSMLNDGKRPDKDEIARELLAKAGESSSDAGSNSVKEVTEANHGHSEHNSSEKPSKPRKRRKKKKRRAPEEHRTSSPVTEQRREQPDEKKATLDDLSDEEKKVFRKRMSSALNNGEKFDRSVEIQKIISERESGTDESDKSVKEAPVVPQETEAGEGVTASTQDKASEGWGSDATDSSSGDQDDAAAEVAAIPKGPFDFPPVEGITYGAVVGVSGGASPLSALTDREKAELKLRVRKALDAGKRGPDINRVAIAREILAEREKNEQQRSSQEPPEVQQYRILTRRSSEGEEGESPKS